LSDRDRSELDNLVTLPVEGAASMRRAAEPEDAGIEELRVALEDLRREIRSRLPDAGAADEIEVDWLALFDEIRSRFSKLGMVDRTNEVDEFGMDAQILAQGRLLLDLLADRYWRIEVVGAEHLPRSGPCLFVGNRAGILPYDGLMVAHTVQRLTANLGRPRFMVADWLITLPFMQPYLARLGGVRACRENADRLLRTGRSVVAFPEGVKGAAKTFRERYRLKRFGRGGVVRAAIENRVPLVPVGIVGSEEAHPVLFKSYLPARLLGLPFIPVTPTFPMLGPLGLLPLPTKWVLSFGEPIDLAEPSGPPDDELLVSRLTEELRVRIQQLVDEGLERRSSVWS
jgi:1-acyl-sn-glycerol-3-phosphate acyltransferase